MTVFTNGAGVSSPPTNTRAPSPAGGSGSSTPVTGGTAKGANTGAVFSYIGIPPNNTTIPSHGPAEGHNEPLVCSQSAYTLIEQDISGDLTYSFLAGVIMGTVDGLSFGLPQRMAGMSGVGIEPLPYELAVQFGKVVGNIIALYIGVEIAASGVGSAVATSPTGVGVIVGAAVAVAGAAVVVSSVDQASNNLVILVYSIKSAVDANSGSNAGQGSGSTRELPRNARSTSNEEEIFRRLERYHGVDRNIASERLHEIKLNAGRGPNDNVLFDMTGNVYDPATREWIGSMTG